MERIPFERNTDELEAPPRRSARPARRLRQQRQRGLVQDVQLRCGASADHGRTVRGKLGADQRLEHGFVRSEERRVGKECRSWWGGGHEKKKEGEREEDERKNEDEG